MAQSTRQVAQSLFGGTKKAAGTKKTVRKVAKRGGKSAGSGATKGWGLPGAGDEPNLSKWYGASRKLYLPGGLLDSNDIPSYCTGELPGDYGLDLFGFSENKADVERFRVYELLHARWAMLGVAGAIIPEALEAFGAPIKGGTWFETGAIALADPLAGTLAYDAAPWGTISNPLPLPLMVAVQVGLMGFVEKYRSEVSGPEGFAPGIGSFTTSDLEACTDPVYPGGPFDPFGLADDPVKFEELKVKEIKNGRLAMVAFLGNLAAAAVTGEGPYANWSKHVADPFGYNLLTVLGAGERTPTL